jgi:hypothetical protein
MLLPPHFCPRGGAVSQFILFLLAAVTPVNTTGLDRTDQRSSVADGLLRRTSPGNGQIIYIVDCGVVDTSETQGRVVQGFSAPGLSTNTPDHGALMASIAAGIHRGMARTANIVSVKICDSATLDIAKFKAGLDWLLTQPPGIVNLSLEFRISVGNPDVATISTKISALRNAGHVVVAAAGNSGVLIDDGSFVALLDLVWVKNEALSA